MWRGGRSLGEVGKPFWRCEIIKGKSSYPSFEDPDLIYLLSHVDGCCIHCPSEGEMDQTCNLFIKPQGALLSGLWRTITYNFKKKSIY